jgi:hypothetical protein
MRYIRGHTKPLKNICIKSSLNILSYMFLETPTFSLIALVTIQEVAK